MAQLNKAQKQAVHAPPETVIVTAGAGTGKTSVLTHRYIELVKSSSKKVHEALSEIVAITFTRKATAEMKQRIGAMGRELGMDLSEAQVQTIDSFFLDLVREYTLYLDLDPAVEVLDGAELTELLNSSVSKILNERINLGTEIAALLKMMNVRRDQFEEGLKLLYQKMRQNVDLQQLSYEDLKGDPVLIEAVLEDDVMPVSECEFFRYQKLILEMLKSIDEDFFRSKKSQGKLDYTDVLDLVIALMNEPNICRAVSESYRHILIDEFQDTNRRQSQVFMKLFKAGSKLFIVGDGKQSIYGFRGSDLRATEEMYEYLESQGANFVILDKNYRSNKSYLLPINACFEDLFPHYDPVDPQLENGETKFISLVNEGSELKSHELEAELMAEKILELAKDHPLHEIALLFRRSSHMALYEEALRKRNIPFENTHGRDFFMQREIMDLILLLRSIQDPEDKLSYVGYLRSPYVGLTDESIYSHMMINGKVLPEEEKLLLKSQEQLLKWRKLSQVTSTFHLLSEIFKDTMILDYYHYSLKDSHAVGRMTKLLNLALEYDQAEPNGLMGLLQLLDNLQREAQMSTGSSGHDAVVLSTIHGAKGLEYEVIFLPDINSDIRRSWDLLNYSGEYGLRIKFDERDPIYESNVEILKDREDEELLRLFYVAVTRGKRQLIIGPRPSKSKGLAQLLEALPFDEETVELSADVLGEERIFKTWDLKTFEPRLRKPTLTATYLLNLQSTGKLPPGQVQGRGHIIGHLIHAYAEALEGCEDNGTLERIIEKFPLKLDVKEKMRLQKLAENYCRTLSKEKVLLRELPFLLDMDEFNLKGTIDQIREREGKLYLLDLKTNRSGATEENISYYTPQLQFYGIAFEELTGKTLSGLELLFLEDESRVPIKKASREELKVWMRSYLGIQGKTQYFDKSVVKW